MMPSCPSPPRTPWKRSEFSCSEHRTNSPLPGNIQQRWMETMSSRVHDVNEAQAGFTCDDVHFHDIGYLRPLLECLATDTADRESSAHGEHINPQGSPSGVDVGGAIAVDDRDGEWQAPHVDDNTVAGLRLAVRRVAGASGSYCYVVVEWKVVHGLEEEGDVLWAAWPEDRSWGAMDYPTVV
ncbi:hypothetical protein GW17_00010882 [Ensete ventricosum]|nr:hypothetical protein GW17_00010882 [Ensete ventricosum]